MTATTRYTVVTFSPTFGMELSFVQPTMTEDGDYALYLPTEKGFSEYLMEGNTADDVHGALTEWADTHYNGSPVTIVVAAAPEQIERLDADSQ